MKTYIIMLAGGKGTRMNAEMNKVLLPLCGKTVLSRSVQAFSSVADEMVIVCRHEDFEFIHTEIIRLHCPFPVRFASGGNTRQESVQNGLQSISPDPDDVILIHDAARCLVDHELIMRVLNSVMEYGTGIPGVPASSTFKVCTSDGFVEYTPERSNLYEIQTPQGFTADTIMTAAAKAADEQLDFTDDSGLLEYYHIPVKITPGSYNNIKLTQPEDLNRARYIIEGAMSDMRIGMGYDVHRFAPERKLILCGVEIPFEFGLLGHSDADVALHALIDAMLGSCALGDIGKCFPDTDEQYKGISSMLLLRKTDEYLKTSGFRLNNVDITIVAQKPKLLPYIPQMVENIASVLNLQKSGVSVKATTTEKLGFEGRMEGISAYAVCTVMSLL